MVCPAVAVKLKDIGPYPVVKVDPKLVKTIVPFTDTATRPPFHPSPQVSVN
jgi:hypothetical protein